MSKNTVAARILWIENDHYAQTEGRVGVARLDQSGQILDGYSVEITTRSSFLDNGLGDKNDYDYVVLRTNQHHVNEPLAWNDGTPVIPDLAMPYYEGYLWHGTDYKSATKMCPKCYSRLWKQINDVIVMEAFRRAEQR